MKPIEIAHCDDSETDRRQLKTKFKLIGKRNPDIEFDYKEYETHLEFEKALDSKVFDYVVLDVYDDKTSQNLAILILDKIATLDTPINVIIYTKTTPLKGSIAKFEQMYKDYDFILGEKISKDAPAKVVDRILENHLLNNLQSQFSLIDKDDIILKVEIRSIGENNLNNIIRKIKFDKKISEDVFIKRMSSGFSGAAVFKLSYGNETSILKVSNDKAVLKDEMDRAKEYFNKFPTRFRIDISPNEEYSANGTSAYLIENVLDGITLFDWLKTNPTKQKIEEFFEDLFLKGDCLSSRYIANRTRKEKYSFINSKFSKDDLKYVRVKTIFKELEPLLDFEYLSVSTNELLNFIKENKYKSINYEDIKETNYITICHGDLHSRNIMIQSNEDPFLIDTGGMKEDYYCMDICRLLSNLFIEGLDNGTKKFFNIEDILEQFNHSKKMIELLPLNLDEKNDSFINAINWITLNSSNIYKGMFDKWEFQLGLLKEFLQISYRKNSIPPNKRALAIMIAGLCLDRVNSHFDNKQPNL